MVCFVMESVVGKRPMETFAESAMGRALLNPRIYRRLINTPELEQKLAFLNLFCFHLVGHNIAGRNVANQREISN
uniref:EAL domain-containing protein n=1 Tax=Rhabditophanes sp. KR3021 TaxID=114890 RepID=A0AC35TZ52_9BILA